MYVYECVCVPHVCGYFYRPRKDIRCPGLEWQGGVSRPHGSWESPLGHPLVCPSSKPSTHLFRPWDTLALKCFSSYIRLHELSKCTEQMKNVLSLLGGYISQEKLII